MQLLLATRNRHKIGELRAILGDRYEIIGLDDLPPAPDAIEDESTFSGNAIKKAVYAAKLAEGRMLTLADDSGLVVDALECAPGVLSARYAQEPGGPKPTDAQNNEKLLRELDRTGDKERTARFLCAIAVASLSSSLADAARATGAKTALREPYHVAICAGVCGGRIIEQPRGAKGFGYDPLFIPHDQELTFAELGEDVKNSISHRARAMQKVKLLLEALAPKPTT